MAVIASDLLAVLVRADHRWTRRSHDDPAPRDYLEALAAAVESVDRGNPAAESELADELERTKRILAQRDADMAKLRDATGQQATEIERLRGVIRSRDDSITTFKEAVQDQKITANLATRHLRRIVEAITGEPATDITEPLVNRAVWLVNAAVDQLGGRIDAGEHVHQYPVGDDGWPGPCACSKAFPRKVASHG